MAAKGEVNGEIKRGATNGANRAGLRPGDFDALASRRSEELGSIPPQAERIGRPGVSAEAPAGNATLSGIQDGKTNPSFEPEEAIHLESTLDWEDIDKEIEETLVELERLKSKVVPIAQQRDSKSESPPSGAADVKKSTAESTRKSRVRITGSSAARGAEEQGWERLEIFRSRIVSSKSARRRRNIVFGLTIAILLGILAYFYLLRSDWITPILELFGQKPVA